MKLYLVLISLLIAFSLVDAGWGDWGMTSATVPTEDFYDLESQYPNALPQYSDKVIAVYNGTIPFVVRSDPTNGYSAFVVRNLYINPTWAATSPTPLYMDNYKIARLEVMLVNWDAGVPDTLTKTLTGDSTVTGAYIPRSGLEGLFHWPTVEGENSWVTLGSSDRSSTAHQYSSAVHLNAEGTDSLWVMIRPYYGCPAVDTTWTGNKMYYPGVYCGVEWELIPSKSDLKNRRLGVVYTSRIPKTIDYVPTGITPAGKSGFVRMYAYGYGGAYNCKNDGSPVRPWSASAPYTELRSVRPDVNTSMMLEEDVCVYRGYGPIKTTVASASSAGAASITVNALPLSWSSYLPVGHSNSFEANWNACLFFNNSDPVDSTSFYSRHNTIVDNGNGTWTVTFVSSDIDNFRGGSSFKPIYGFDVGDTVLFTGNWWMRGTGGEDWPAFGGFYNVNARTWSSKFGFPVVKNLDYALDSVLANGTSILRGESIYRMFGGKEGTSLVFDETPESRIRFYQQKTRATHSASGDSLWHYTWNLEATLVYYTNDLLDGNTPTYPYKESWTSSAGDACSDRAGGSLASWSTLVNAATASNLDATASVKQWDLVTFLTDGSLKVARFFFPFATETGSSPWDATGKTIKRVTLVLYVSNFDTRVTQADPIARAPWWTDSTEFWVVSSTQASMSTMVAGDFDNVGEDSLGGGRWSQFPGAYYQGTEPFEFRIPVSPSILVDGQDTKLALRMKKFDIQEIPPVVGAQRYMRFTNLYFSEHALYKPRLEVEYTMP